MPRTSDADFRVAFGTRIRHARVAAGLSQGALAARVGISFQQVGKYESGRDSVSLERLVTLAAALGRPPAEFLDDQPDVAQLPVRTLRERLRSADAVDGLVPEVRRRALALLAVLPRADAAAQAESSEREAA